ncbi:acetylcholine receptor subunit alpha-like isoform X2 [Portunus trituberculatus]|uniref:acetylcholine receptor subunit alpha-like isoform X2 n=1 Tax=Portunus trituberculatus TaxID=210409 RepID=UPI001E1CC357|nr:acetylcholine receptor subunit alpha-like isoform X2 [Portunus trituberculatus]
MRGCQRGRRARASFRLLRFLAVGVALVLALCPEEGTCGNPDAKRLYDDLLSNYNKLVRPVINVSDPLVVKIKLKLSQLIDVNLKNQIMTTNLWVEQFWYDYKLKWDPEEYGGVLMLHVPSDHVWRPDIVLYNNADGNFEVTLSTKATLHYDGLVEWKPPAIYKSSCEIDVEFFPFDEQTCVMKFGSWTYDGFQVDLRHIDEKKDNPVVEIGVDLTEFYTSVEWDILAVPAIRNEKYYTCCNEPYLDITFNITMRRKTLFYTVNLIIPCMGISFLTVLVFYLPSDSGEKVSLSISILLSLTVFFLLLAEIIPPTSLVVPLLGKFVLFTMILDTLSICVTVVVLNVHFRSPQTHSMAPWVRRVFIHILPRLLVMRRPQYQMDRHRLFAKTKAGMLRSCNGGDMRDACNYYSSESFQDSRENSFRSQQELRDAIREGLIYMDMAGSRPRSPHSEYSPSRDIEALGINGGCKIHGPAVLADDLGVGLNGNVGSPGRGTTDNGSTQYCPEVMKAFEGVKFIAEHTRREEESCKVKEDWKYVAMVLDRLFLWIFTLAVLLGTAGIILQAPTLYDDRIPIDILYSEIVAAGDHGTKNTPNPANVT